MADNLLYEMSQMTENTSEPFVKKEIVWISDSNGGSYNGQIIFETSSLANSGKWVSWNEAIIELPIIYGLRSSVDIANTTGPNPYMMGTKCGFHHFVDSIQVDYNNTNVVQITSYTNFYVSFKMMTSWSSDDVAKYGALYNFFPDTPNSFNYSTTATSNGIGITNNVVYPLTAWNITTAAGGHVGDKWNSGLFKRLQNCGYSPTAGSGSCYAFMTESQATTIGKSYFTYSSETGTARIFSWSVLAKIPLKHLADFFDKIPLVKGAFLKIVLNTNTSSSTLNITQVANVMSISSTANNTITGRTNPIMITSVDANNPGNTVANTVADNLWYIGCGIKDLTLNGSTVTHKLLSQARIYVPAYTLNPTFEDQLLSLHPTKEVVYRDIYQYTISSVTANGGSISQLLTNGITNPKLLVILPMLNSASTNNATTTVITPYASPFSSEPHTTSPLLSISDFNVQVSGINLFNENKSYDFDSFYQELRGVNAVNGGLTSGLTSGLIGEYEFSTGYRYYVCDLSRRLPLDDTVAKSILVMGKNNSAKIVDYFCFIEYQRSITIDMATGAIIPQ